MVLKPLRVAGIFLLTAWALAAQFATPITPPGRIAGPIVFGQSLRTSGMVGLAAGQTARLNLLNPQVQPTAATGASCSAAVGVC
jgi:hypothetical protein